MEFDDAMNHPFYDPSMCGRRTCFTHPLLTPADRELFLKIRSAFSGLKFHLKRIIFQFWRPRDDDGRLVLECLCNPYAVSRFNRLLHGVYRSLCTRYKYSTDDEGDNPPNSNPPWIISSGGPVVTTFLNHFPEVVLDLRVYRGSPLVDCALECDLTCCMMLPIFDRHYSECVGVVECSMKHSSLLIPVFKELKRELERNGLSIYHVQGSWPYKVIPGDFEAAKFEIAKGLKIACESHQLTLGQVWISYESSQIDQTLLVKLTGYALDSHKEDCKEFFDKLDVLSGKGLAWKTLETHQSYFCKNICKLSENKGVLAVLSSNAKCSSLVICLRSTHTGELDYAFEFFWPCSRDHLILLDSLFLTLRNYLPSFTFPSGDNLSVVEVENSSFDVEGADDDNNDDDDVAISATYRNEACLCYLSKSSTFENVMEKLNKEFELDPIRTYNIEYEVSPGQWSSLVCLESCRRIDDMGLIKLRVRVEGKLGWRWITNT